nr:retrovirus-related Pol polyprotein from transposon TNT 1-94 [Tanacetum cinerariifolium]
MVITSSLYAKSRLNGKLIYNSIINGPYVRRMILEPGDQNREVPVLETFHKQTDNELTEAEIKQMEADDQAIQTILLGLPEDIYAAQASTLGTQSDKAPVYDSNGSVEVQLHDNCYDDEILNIFTQEEQYTKLLKPIFEPHQVLQNNSIVTSVVYSVEQGEGTVEQHPVNVKETSVLYDSLYNNLATGVEKVNLVNPQKIFITQLGDLKGKSKDTPYVSDTLDPLPQKLENENIELEFQKFLGTVCFGNDHVAVILGFSDPQWGNILVTDVYFVKGLEHNLLSHLNFDTINNLAKNDLVTGLSKFKYHKKHLCPLCEQGENKRASHPPKPVPNSNQRLHLLHMDLCGPMRIASIIGKWYVLQLLLRATLKTAPSFTVNLSKHHASLLTTANRISPFFMYLGPFVIPDHDYIGKLGAKGLDLLYAPSTITSQKLTEGELDLLFEAIYDDHVSGQPSVAPRIVSAAQAPQVLQTLMTTTTIVDITPTPTNSSSQATNIPITL